MEEKGTPLAYEARGSGHPLVLIHTTQVDSRVWEYQMDALAERFRVIRYDLRNHGQSPRCAEPYDAQQDLVELLDALEIQTAHLAGLAAGGGIALDFALRDAHRVSALVLIGSGISVDRTHLHLLLDVGELSDELAPTPELLTALRAGDVGPMIDNMIASSASPQDEAARQFLRRMMRENAYTFTQPSAARPKMLDPPAIGRLGEITVPTLVMVGERDLAHIKRNADLLHQGITGATKVIVSGAGGYPNLEKPEFFNDTVTHFLSGIS